MNFDFLDRRSAERFAELLDETGGVRRHQTRGQADEHLAELVAIGHSLSAARTGVQVDQEFRTGLRAMLVATAERDGIGETAAAAEPEPAEPVRQLIGRTGRRIRARGAIVIGVAAGAMAVSGISAASDNAAPGDALYGVKRSTERAQLAMAGSDITRGQLSLTFARNRLAEAASMQGDNPKFRDVLGDMDNDTRKGVKLLTNSAVTRRDKATLTSIDSFVVDQRRVLDPRLDRVDGDNRERAQVSLDLLDSVSERTDDLRTGLNCPEVVQSGGDAIGPKLKGCTTGASATAPDDRPGTSTGTGRGQGQEQGQSEGRKQKETKYGGADRGDTGKKARPTASAEPTGEPTAGTKAARPGRAEPSADVTEPEPLISEDPFGAVDEDVPGTEEDKGLLGGLLGNIFGS